MLKMHLPYDQAIVLLVIFLREMKTYTQIKFYIQLFITVLFIIVKNWKQSKHPSMDEW